MVLLVKHSLQKISRASADVDRNQVVTDGLRCAAQRNEGLQNEREGKNREVNQRIALPGNRAQHSGVLFKIHITCR